MRTNKHITLSPLKSKYLLYTLIAIAFIGFAVYGAKSVVHLKGSLDSSQIRLKNNQVELQNLNTQLEKEKADKNSSQEQIQKLEQEKKDLESQLQAKADAKAKLAQAAKDALNKATGTTVAYAAALPTGSHEDWMAAAGIAPSDYSYVNYIVNHESGWNPTAVNPKSGACGLGQQLPCGKWAGAWDDPIAALVAMQGYALDRYKSWANAYSFWVANNWW